MAPVLSALDRCPRVLWSEVMHLMGGLGEWPMPCRSQCSESRGSFWKRSGCAHGRQIAIDEVPGPCAPRPAKRASSASRACKSSLCPPLTCSTSLLLLQQHALTDLTTSRSHQLYGVTFVLLPFISRILRQLLAGFGCICHATRPPTLCLARGCVT